MKTRVDIQHDYHEHKNVWEGELYVQKQQARILKYKSPIAKLSEKERDERDAKIMLYAQVACEKRKGKKQN